MNLLCKKHIFFYYIHIFFYNSQTAVMINLNHLLILPTLQQQHIVLRLNPSRYSFYISHYIFVTSVVYNGLRVQLNNEISALMNLTAFWVPVAQEVTISALNMIAYRLNCRHVDQF